MKRYVLYLRQRGESDIENVKLSLIGIVATRELARSSFAASRCTGIVLTRGALQPFREALALLREVGGEVV